MRVTTVIGLATLVVTGLVLIAATTRISSGFLQAQDSAALQSVEDALEARFDVVRVAMDSAATASGSSNAGTSKALLNHALAGSGGACDYGAILDESGRTILATPSLPSTLPSQITSLGVSGQRGYVEITPAGRRRIWLARSVRLPNGHAGVVVLRLASNYVTDSFDLAVGRTGVGTAFIASTAEQVVVAQHGGQVGAGSLIWHPQQGRTGGVVIVRDAASGHVMQGPYISAEGLPGVEWKVAVVEQQGAALTDTMNAVFPTLLVLALGGAISLGVTWYFARRLVWPLQDLEKAALQGANGAYVKPIASDRDDEIGRVSEAFNAVTLRLNALHDVSQLLASASRLDQVLDGILTATAHIVGPGVSAVYLLDDSGKELRAACVKGPTDAPVNAVPATGEGWLARVLVSDEPSTFDLPAELLGDELPGLPVGGAGTALAAPLIAGHEPLGVVVAVPEADHALSQAELEMLRTFSAQAAVAVQNSRLFANETESRVIAEQLRDIAETLVRPDVLHAALISVESKLVELLGAAWARVVIIDRGVLNMPAADDSARDAELLGLALRALVGTESCRPQLLDPGDPDVTKVMERTGAESIVVTPIALDTEHGAVLAVGLQMAEGKPTDFDVIEAVCSELALALDNAFFYGRALSRAANLEMVFRISQVVGSSLQIKVVLNRVLDVVQKIFSADTVVLMTYDTSKRVVATDMARGNVSPALLNLEVRPGEDIPGYVFASGEPAAFVDLSESMGGLGGHAASRGLHSLIAVPLVARDRSIGVLMAFSEQPGAFSDEDVSVLQTFASQAALAIDTARLYSREHDLSQTLQASIMPEKLPAFDEIDTGSVYVPAAAPVADIGGDYFDAVRAPDGSIVLAMADVCGKGVEAATKTSMIKFSVRALVAAGFSPSRILDEVNRMVCETGSWGDIVTVWIGALHASAGSLCWADGGHPPALLRRVDGTIESLGTTGPLLGAVPSVVFGQEEICVSSGDVLLLYTDGVTEARSGNKLFGEERLRRCLEAPGSPREMADRVLDAVRRYVRGDIRDDVAILAVQVNGMNGQEATEENQQ